MTQMTFAFVGLVAALLYSVALRRRRMGPLAAIVVGVGGAWTGALLAATASRTGWASWGPISLVGSVAGGVGALVIVDLVAGSVRRREAR